ncbi:hypothetical protein SALBM217S_08524 [Streptomyces griseoloalbus]
MEAGGDQPVAGLDHAGVTVGGAGLHDHHGLRGPGGGVDEGGAVGGGKFVEHVGDGDEVGGLQGERGPDPGALPAGGAQGGVTGGQLTAEVQRGRGPVQHGHRTLPVPGRAHRPRRRAGAAAHVDMAPGHPPGHGIGEGTQRRVHRLERGGHAVRGIRGHVGAVAQDGGVGGGGPPVVRDQPLDGLSGLPRGNPVQHPPEGGTQGVGGGEGGGGVHPAILVPASGASVLWGGGGGCPSGAPAPWEAHPAGAPAPWDGHPAGSHVSCANAGADPRLHRGRRRAGRGAAVVAGRGVRRAVPSHQRPPPGRRPASPPWGDAPHASPLSSPVPPVPSVSPPPPSGCCPVGWGGGGGPCWRGGPRRCPSLGRGPMTCR